MDVAPHTKHHLLMFYFAALTCFVIIAATTIVDFVVGFFSVASSFHYTEGRFFSIEENCL